MDIKKVEDTIKKSESLINTTWGILTRNWGKLIVICLIAISVWFTMLVMDEVENPTEDSDEYYEEGYDEYTEEE